MPDRPAVPALGTDSAYETPKCGCHQVCGDLPEDRDDPRAVCRGLRLPPREPLVEIVLEYRAC